MTHKRKLLHTDRPSATNRVEQAPAPPALAPEFIELLFENAVTTLAKWLRDNGAPSQVSELVLNLDTLSNYASLARRGNAPAAKEYGIDDIVIESVNAIAVLGGVFKGPHTQSAPREPLKWEPTVRISEP